MAYRRWIGILLGSACCLVSLFQLEHSISWSIGIHGKILANNIIFTVTLCVVFALLAAAAFLWSRSAPKSDSTSD